MYKIAKKIFEYLEPKLRPIIPEEITQIGERFGIDLYEVRYRGKVLSIEQVDVMLERYPDLQSFHRMHVKNSLSALKLMEQGLKPAFAEESRLLGLAMDNRTYYPPTPQIWNNGQLPKKHIDTSPIAIISVDYEENKPETYAGCTVRIFHDGKQTNEYSTSRQYRPALDHLKYWLGQKYPEVERIFNASSVDHYAHDMRKSEVQ